MSFQDFNPNDIGVSNGNLFGLPCNFDESELVIIPVPWDVTVSYGGGTAKGPQAILDASTQVDLYDLDYGNFWQRGIFMMEISSEIQNLSKKHRALAVEIIKLLESGVDPKTNAIILTNTEKINAVCDEMRHWVYEQASKYIKHGKKLALLGGDHSTPLGIIQALSHEFPDMGILQIDAHCDLRMAYEGFKYSHASIMYNVLNSTSIKKLVQVGIRDFCEEEMDYAAQSNNRIEIFYDRKLKDKLYSGETWKSICDEIVSKLPQHVYISFDIDGLNPSYCPNTGTPVAGGLEIDQVFYLINAVKKSGRKIISFDLNEVGDSEWDGNVGARVLYRLCGALLTEEHSS
ncbi:MAG: agmatinase family protein [Chitinophagales bacterium]|nr:agmatinase family protein [Chitinophagales bacterium]